MIAYLPLNYDTPVLTEYLLSNAYMWAVGLRETPCVSYYPPYVIYTVEIVLNAAQMFDGLHLKRPATCNDHLRSLPLLPFDRPYRISY